MLLRGAFKFYTFHFSRRYKRFARNLCAISVRMLNVKYAVRAISIDRLENDVKKKWHTPGVVPGRPYRANDEKAPPIVASD